MKRVVFTCGFVSWLIRLKSLCRCVVDRIKLRGLLLRLLFFTIWHEFQNLWIYSDLENLSLKQILLLPFILGRYFDLSNIKKWIYFLNIFLKIWFNVDCRFCNLCFKVIFERFYFVLIISGSYYFLNRTYFTLRIGLQFRHIKCLLIIIFLAWFTDNVDDLINVIDCVKMFEKLILFLW